MGGAVQTWPINRPHLLAALRRHAHPLARLGCAAIGTVYVLIGGVALVALTGHLIEYADPDRIGQLLRRVPGGVVLLWAIAAGALAYLAWRVIEALSDPYDVLSGWWGVAKRAGVALSGLAYGFLAYSAVRIAVSPPSGARDASERHQQHLVARVLHWPDGAWLVGAVGLAVFVVAGVQFWMVFRRSYTREIRMQPRTRTHAKVLTLIGAYGYSARGVLLGILGYFFIEGAVLRSSAVVGDMDTAFDFIGGGTTVGNTLFAVVAIGIVAYGVFMYANAWLYKFEMASGRPRAREP
jgi:hypothetical protein